MGEYRAELTGLFGDPVDDNPTGVVMEAAYRAKGLNYRYITMKVAKGRLEDAVRGARAIGMKGFGLTMPHKIDIIPFLDSLSQAASIIGAVNTVVNIDGGLFGENTDGKGFVSALKLAGESPAGKTITILGSGGAARAVAVESALAGAKIIHVINRNEARGQELTALLNEKTGAEAIYHPWQGEADISENTDILINGTCVGLVPDVNEKPAIHYERVREGMIACDVVFNPVDTLFLKACRARGAKTVDGTGMLVQQAALGFKLWTDEEAPLQVMYDALTAEF